jgi:type IV pilus assembly protein PilP
MMTFKKTPRSVALAPLLASLLLAGCSDSNVREVRTWMDQVKRDTRVSIKPLQEPKDFIPFAYGEKEAVDPFSPNKLLAELAREGRASSNPFKPDTDRPREMMEGFPLDTMSMVGIIQKSGINYALLQIDRTLYQVRTGQRIGQNFGIVTKVGEQEVDIREVVQDAGGEWVERMSKLELQEGKEKGK